MIINNQSCLGWAKYVCSMINIFKQVQSRDIWKRGYENNMVEGEYTVHVEDFVDLGSKFATGKLMRPMKEEGMQEITSITAGMTLEVAHGALFK